MAFHKSEWDWWGREGWRAAILCSMVGAGVTQVVTFDQTWTGSAKHRSGRSAPGRWSGEHLEARADLHAGGLCRRPAWLEQVKTGKHDRKGGRRKRERQITCSLLDLTLSVMGGPWRGSSREVMSSDWVTKRMGHMFVFQRRWGTWVCSPSQSTYVAAQWWWLACLEWWRWYLEAKTRAQVLWRNWRVLGWMTSMRLWKGKC